jgi:hypothetical protein
MINLNCMSIHSFIHISQSPVKQLSNETWKQTQPYTEGLHTMGCSLLPQGDCLWHCCYYPSALQPSAQYTPPWLGYTTALLASVCVGNPLQGILSSPVTTSHVTQGRDCQHTSSQQHNYLNPLQSSVIATQVTGVQAETAFVTTDTEKSVEHNKRIFLYLFCSHNGMASLKFCNDSHFWLVNYNTV